MTQHYILGIGHPATQSAEMGAPAVFSADGKSLVGTSGETMFPAIQIASNRALRKAIDAVKTGSAASGPLLVVGDSTDRGPNGTASQAWPTYLAAELNTLGVPTSIDSVFGASNFTNTAAFVAADPRVALGTGWFFNSAVKSAGGFCFEFPANTTPAPMAFTPSAAFNQVDIYYYKNTGAGLGTFTVDRSGTAPTAGSPVDSNTGPQAVAKVTLNWGTTAAGPLNINVPSASSPKVRIIGVVCRNTASPKLEIINAAWAGSCSQDWISAPSVLTGAWSPQSAVAAIAPSAIIWGHKINDFNSGTTEGGTVSPLGVANYEANLNSYASLVAGSTIIFARKAQSNPATFATVSFQNEYQDVDLSYAAENGNLCVDFQSVCGDYTQAQSDGLNLDTRHYNALGSNRGARLAARLLSNL